MEAADMELVLSSTDASQIPVIKSILESEKIPFFPQGDIHSAIETRLPVRFLVPKSHVERAKEALKQFL